MKKLCLLLLAGLLVCTGYAQKDGNIWYFGEHAGLDFNTTPPTPLMGSSMSTYEGCSSIAHPLTGQCLFYTDGITVWDRNHAPMPGSLATPLNGDPSSTNSGVIVPKPGSSNLYYIFTTAAQVGIYGFPPTMCYSLVDMNLNGGNGDVIHVNNVIIDSTTEKIAVVANCDRSVYWIVGHRWNCDTFYAFRLTASGLEAPVKSKAGMIHYHAGSGQFAEAIGYMKFSSDGTKLAVVTHISLNTLQVLDFDFNTGIVSNPLTDVVPAADLPDPYSGPYGCSFSPDNTKLYVGWTGADHSWIYQYDMNAGNPAAIVASRTLVATMPPTVSCGALQNGPDGKMYVATAGVLTGRLGVINNPNAAGTACNYVDGGQDLNGRAAAYGLPAMVESFLSPAGPEVFQLPRTWLCREGDTIRALQSGHMRFSITPATGMDVNADSTLFRFFPEQTTTYTVISTGGCGTQTTSFTITRVPGPSADFVFDPVIPNIAGGNITLLNRSSGAQGYSWYDNNNPVPSHDVNYTFANPREGHHCYTLVAADTAGCTDTALKCITMENGGNTVFIPNTFSPNGDGLNDIFRPFGGHIKLNSFSVFNRYGQRVFYTTHIKEAWDGTYNGTACDMGTYYYLIRYTRPEGPEETRKGNITLIR